MQAAPTESPSAVPSASSSSSSSPSSMLRTRSAPKFDHGQTSNASNSSSNSLEHASANFPAMYISTSDNEPVEEVISQDTSLISLLYDPAFDDITREIAQLTDLRRYMDASPAMLWHFYELIPNATDSFYSLSLQSEGLRHALLAVATVVRDAMKGPEPSEMYLLERTKSLRCLQEDLSSENITDALAMAVLMHISMDVLSGHLRYTQRHLRGLYLVFQRLKQEAAAKKKDLTPVARLLQRMVIRVDFAMSSLYADENQFEALTPNDEIADKKWLMKFSGPSEGIIPKNIEWVLASFEMDNLMHRVYSFGRRSAVLRSMHPPDPLADEKIGKESQLLMQALELWKQRGIIREQEEIERYGRLVTPAPTDPMLRFLHHEPIYLQNRYYAKILNQWRTVLLWVSLIVHPVPGLGPYSDNRYATAVDICRTHAALGAEAMVGPSWQCLYFAGMVFGGRKLYPMESQWILDQLRFIGVVYPMVARLVDAMPSVWEADAFVWTGLADLFKDVGLMDS